MGRANTASINKIGKKAVWKKALGTSDTHIDYLDEIRKIIYTTNAIENHYE